MADIHEIEQAVCDALHRAVTDNRIFLKKKTKTVKTEYDEELKKPVLEITEEQERLVPYQGKGVDMAALKQAEDILRSLRGGTENGRDKDKALGGVVILAAEDEGDEEEHE